MKQNLISIVQDILSDMDSENVNTLSDSVEAEQVAKIVRTTYFNIIATRDIPEHEQLIKLVAASDNQYPTHFKYNNNVKHITNVWYQDSEEFYHEVCWVEPLEFLRRTDSSKSHTDLQVVLDKNAGTRLYVGTTQDPSFYTSFDDEWIVMNSFHKGVDSTLQESKVRAYGSVYPTFEISDTFVPDLDNTLFPYLIAEAKSTAMSLLKSGSDPKIEQAARRQKSYLQNDMFKTERENTRVNYGRR